jgi:hypothetical protein
MIANQSGLIRKVEGDKARKRMSVHGFKDSRDQEENCPPESLESYNPRALFSRAFGAEENRNVDHDDDLRYPKRGGQANDRI